MANRGNRENQGPRRGGAGSARPAVGAVRQEGVLQGASLRRPRGPLGTPSGRPGTPGSPERGARPWPLPCSSGPSTRYGETKTSGRSGPGQAKWALRSCGACTTRKHTQLAASAVVPPAVFWLCVINMSRLLRMRERPGRGGGLSEIGRVWVRGKGEGVSVGLFAPTRRPRPGGHSICTPCHEVLGMALA